MFNESVTYSAALFAGLLSFFSPCILPLIPAWFSFITGYSLDRLIGDNSRQLRKNVFISTLAYVSGFSTVFIAMGASASYAGGLVSQYSDYIRIIGGIIIIVLGIHMTGLLRIKGLDFEKRLHMDRKPLHFFGTFLIGMAFGAGWSPCIGPLLGSILIVAGSRDTVWEGVRLLSVYSLGLAAPFLILSLFVNVLVEFVKRMNKFIKYANMTAGLLLVIMGIILITDKLYIVTNLF